jgi:rhamnogalacturonan endolyase
MPKMLGRFLAATFAVASLSFAAHADDIPLGTPIPVGFISYDVTGTNVAQFDIVNFTGANASTPPDMTFPITTPVPLSDLSLTIDFADGSSQVFGSSYFTLDADGLSFDGEQLSTLSGPPTGLFGATDAVLTGVFDASEVTLNDGSQVYLGSHFSATISDPGGLSDGDLAVINATTVPEPATWTMLGMGLFGLVSITGAGTVRRRFSGVALGLAGVLALLLFPATSNAQATVKLNAVTSPSSGTAGTSTVSVTGSGFPSGAISPANALVSLATSCGGSPTTAAASTVTTVIGTTDKVAFAIPGSLAAGTYYVSLSGTSNGGTSFSSSSCSTLQVLAGQSPTLSIDTTNPVDWIIKNGAMTIDYNSTSGAIWSIVPTGTQDQLIDFSPGNATINGSVYDPANGESAIGGTTIPSTWSGPSGIPNLPASFANKEPKGFYMDLSGFTTVTAVPGYSLNSSYLDWWVAYPASGVSPTNTTEYEEHFVVTPNDPGVHIYFSLSHPAQVMNSSGTLVNNGSGTIGGQVQWIWRGNVNAFTNYYQRDTDLSMMKGVVTPLPSTDDCFSSDNGRNDQDVTGRDTIDLHPQVGVENAFSPYPDPASQIPQGFHRHYCVKYDYSSYEYLHQAHGLFGSKYGQWVVFTPGHDTFIDGPTKENLSLTGNILTIEPNSNHYRTGGVGTTSIASGTAGSRLYGPYYVRINHFGMNTDSSIDGGVIQTPDDMFNDAVGAGGSFTSLYNNEATLMSKGYIPTTSRGSVAIQVNGVAGTPRTAWAVLSQNGVNQENSTMSYQYTIDISANGTGTFTNVVPGTYRLSVWDFGKWGEYRQDNVVVTAGNTNTVPAIGFVPENFGTVVGTIGTPDRSSHEFLHGAYTQDYADGPKGYDDREYYGAWNYWADWANSPVPGAPVYNLTDGPGYTATNDPLKWNYAHWGGFNPGLYGGACSASDDTTDAYTYVGCTSLGDQVGIPAYVNTLPGHSGTNGVNTPTPPWQVHFATPSGASSQAFVVLSLALSSSQGKETVTLNGNSLSYTPPSAFNSDAIERSGLSGYTQWVAFQWPTSLLNAEGADNVITTQVSGVNSNNSDDALRLELTNISADPAMTNWHDYYFVTSGKTTPASDTVPNQ